MSDRVGPSATVAGLLAVVGLVAATVRPRAPGLEAATALTEFAPEVLAVVESYRGPRRIVTAVIIILSVVVPVAAVGTGPGRRALHWIVGTGSRPAVRGGLVALAVLAAVDVATLPARYLGGFVLDGRFAFRTAGIGAWTRDLLIASAGGWLVAFLAGACLVLAMRRWPRSWHLRLPIAATGATAAIVLVGPLVIEPLLLPTSPLPEGEVREAVRAVTVRAGDPDVPLLVGDASRRTTKVNAYVTGLGPTRRVVLFDTLLHLPADQVAAVVAHEVAHRLHRDVERGVALSAAGYLALGLAAGAAVRSAWARRLSTETADPRMVAVVAAIAAVGWALALPVVSHVSRTLEAAADHRALELTGDPATQIALQRSFVLRDLADPAPPWWYEDLIASHPSTNDRIRAAAGWAASRGVPLPAPDELRPAEQDLLHPALR